MAGKRKAAGFLVDRVTTKASRPRTEIPNDQYYVSDSATIKVEDYSRRAAIFAFCDKSFRITP